MDQTRPGRQSSDHDTHIPSLWRHTSKVSVLVLALTLVLAVTDVQGQTTCDIGWTPFDGNCYVFIRPSPRVTWSGAQQICSLFNSHLVNIASAAENAFVLSLINRDAWIGLNDRDTEGVFRWDDQPTVVPPYTNFATLIGLPDNRPPGEDCAVMFSAPPFFAGFWNDDNCEGVLRDVVCERGDSAPVVVTTPPPTPPNLSPCPPGWTVFQTTCFKYFDSSPKLTWPQARQACIMEGGHLADIRSPEENAAAHALLMSDSWIGYNDITIEGTFTWDFTGDSGTYTNWNFLGGEPSNDPPGEDCVTMYENVPGPGTWNDDKCESSLRDYICERGFITGQRTGEPDVACPQGWEPFGDSCYIPFNGPVTFPIANQTCVNLGGYLATVSDADENAFVHGQITVDSWIGYTDIDIEGTFRWVTGEPTTYTNWLQGAPDNLSPGQDCTLMYAAQPGPGEWNDQGCSEMNGFVCERGRVVVNCNSTYMGFHVAKGLLRPFVIGDFLHLNDPTCRVQEDDDFYSLTWRLDQCQNEINFTANSTYIYIINQVHHTPTTPGISRERSTEVTVICRLYNLGSLSSGPLAPEGLEFANSTQIIDVVGFGNLGGHLSLTDSSFVNPITTFPHVVQLNDEIYLRILLIADFGDLGIFARHCYGTSDADPKSTPQHTLIRDHCPVDETVVIRPASVNLFRFSARAFEFVGRESQLYIHCEFQACPITAVGSRCSQGCITPNGGNRRRRQLDNMNSGSLYPADITLTQGPFIRGKKSASSRITPHTILLIGVVLIACFYCQ